MDTLRVIARDNGTFRFTYKSSDVVMINTKALMWFLKKLKLTEDAQNSIHHILQTQGRIELDLSKVAKAS